MPEIKNRRPSCRWRIQPNICGCRDRAGVTCSWHNCGFRQPICRLLPVSAWPIPPRRTRAEG